MHFMYIYIVHVHMYTWKCTSIGIFFFMSRVCCRYCAISQGSLDWFEVNLMCPYCLFVQKSPTIDGSFAERDLQLNASYGSNGSNVFAQLVHSELSDLCVVFFFFLAYRSVYQTQFFPRI